MGHEHEKRATRPAPIPVRAAARGQRNRGQFPTPFDPDELSRRLYAVIADQKAHAERQRRARGEADKRARGYGQLEQGKPSPQVVPHPRTLASRDLNIPGGESPNGTDTDGSDPYRLQKRPELQPNQRGPGRLRKPHAQEVNEENLQDNRHVPELAATQSTRNTTADSAEERIQFHRLSRQAMKFHMDGPNRSVENPAAIAGNGKPAPFEAARNLRMVQTEREKQYERNQFQHPAISEQAVDQTGMPPRLIQRHTFETYFRGKDSTPGAHATAKRSSISNIPIERPSLEMMESTDPHNKRQESRGIDDGRADWTQSGEIDNRENVEDIRLRKSASKWTLKGRFGGIKKQQLKEEKATVTNDPSTETTVSPTSPKSPMTGFFSRFKRQIA